MHLGRGLLGAVGLALVCASTPVRASDCTESTAVDRRDMLGALVRGVAAIFEADPVPPSEPVVRHLDRDAEIAHTKAYVARCIKDRYSVWRFVDARMRSTECCRAADDGDVERDSVSGDYRLSFADGRVVLTKSLVLLYQGSDEEQARVEKKVADAKALLEKVFDAHGVKLNLQLTFIGPPANDVPLDWASEMFLHDVVTVYDETPKGQIRPWSNQWVFPAWQPDAQALGVILHEFSHTLGLPDSYSDNVTCPLRTLIEPDTVITSTTQLHTDEGGTVLNFYAADHIEALLAPLCGE